MSAIGIDFGASSSKIGCFNQFGIKIIANGYKNTSTPSVAFFDQTDRWVFGEKAVKLGTENTKKIIFDMKLMVGMKFNDPLIQSKANYWPFKIKNVHNNIKIVIENNNKTFEFYPYQIVGLIFKYLIKSKKNFSKESQIIISIPAIYNENQIIDLTKAAKFAGFQNFEFQSEPILSSLAYLYNQNVDLTKDYNILIYDFGSSHLDVSIIKLHNKTYEIFTEQGDICGKQFDDNIHYYVKEQMKKKYKQMIDFFERPKIDSILYQKCIEAKTFLSEFDEVEIFLGNENQLSFTLTLEKFNEINDELFERSMNPVKKVFQKAEINKESIDNLFLVGGCTYIKKIRKLLFDMVKKVPCPSVDPREAIAIGACIAGAWIKDNNNNNNEENHDYFNPAIDILMSKNDKIITNSEENDHILTESKERNLLQSTKQVNLQNQKDENDPSDSEINYFWFNKNKKTKQNQNQNNSCSKQINSSKAEKNCQPSQKTGLIQDQNNCSPDQNVSKKSSFSKEKDSPKPKINYFWFNENVSPMSTKNRPLFKSNENNNLTKPKEIANSTIDNSLEDKNRNLSNSDEKQNLINSNEIDLLNNEKDDLSNSSENNPNKAKGVPLYVCLKEEDGQSKQSQSKKSCQNDSVTKDTKTNSRENTPQKFKPNDLDYQKRSKHSPNKSTSAIQDNNCSTEKDTKTNSKQNSPRKINSNNLYGQNELKSSPNKSTSAIQDYNCSTEKDTKTNSKQNTPRKINSNNLYGRNKSSPYKFNIANQVCNYSPRNDSKTRSNSKQSSPQKSNSNDSNNQEEPISAQKVSIYPQYKNSNELNDMSYQCNNNSVRKTNFNIYNNNLISNYQIIANNKQKNSINSRQNQCYSNYPKKSNDTKTIFFKIHKTDE